MGPAALPPEVEEQAVWNRFPSTDPDVTAQIAGLGDPAASLSAFMDLAEGDDQLLAQMRRAQLDELIAQLLTPAMPPVEEIAAPEMGGEGSGF